MIKELRIGNWILPQHDLDGAFHKVDYLTEDSINGYIPGWYSPIPLTLEILEQCGFELDEDAGNWHSPEHKIYRYKSFWIGIREDYIAKWNAADDDFYSTFYPQIKYLHQLQNLYFVWIGEELNFQSALVSNNRQQDI